MIEDYKTKPMASKIPKVADPWYCLQQNVYAWLIMTGGLVIEPGYSPLSEGDTVVGQITSMQLLTSGHDGAGPTLAVPLVPYEEMTRFVTRYLDLWDVGVAGELPARQYADPAHEFFCQKFCPFAEDCCRKLGVHDWPGAALTPYWPVDPDRARWNR